MPNKKPQLMEHILLEKKIIGAIMRDADGYFYRPKYNSISVAPYNAKKDGDRFAQHKDCKRSLGPLE